MAQTVSGADVTLAIDSPEQLGKLDPATLQPATKSGYMEPATKSGYLEPGRRLTHENGATGRVVDNTPAFGFEYATDFKANGLDGGESSDRRRTDNLRRDSVKEMPAGQSMREFPGGQSVRDMGVPYPKWPANWKTGVFESVAAKKSLILSPPEIYAECAHHGEEKAKMAWYKMVLLSMIAGCYVGFGFTLCLQVGGLMNEAPGGPKDKLNLGVFRLVFGAVGFPFAFTSIVVCGAELYTSLCAYMMAAWWEGKVSMLDCIRVWFVSWWGNFAGCAIIIGLFFASGIYDDGNDRYLLRIAEAKTHHPWGQAFVRGIFANWLVGLATWQANAAQDLTGKFIGIWLPISAFAMIGFEHCIANQFVIPMGLVMGAKIDRVHVIWFNLIPSTLGNLIGGGVCVATVYAFIYGRPPIVIKDFITNLRKKQI